MRIGHHDHQHTPTTLRRIFCFHEPIYASIQNAAKYGGVLGVLGVLEVWECWLTSRGAIKAIYRAAFPPLKHGERSNGGAINI